MRSTPPELDRFIHTLASPLTALQGSVSLLRRRIQGYEDQRLLDLFATLERSSERLRRACDLIINHATLRSDRIIVELPVSTLVDLTSPLQAAAVERYPEGGDGSEVVVERQVLPVVHPATGKRSSGEFPLLLLARRDALPPGLAEMLRERGHRLVWADSTAEGIDLARQLKPCLIVIDPALDDRGRLAAGILSDDPDTKMISLALLGVDAAADMGGAITPLLTIDVRASVNTLVRLFEEALAVDAERKKPHILIVDDEPDIAQLIAQQFTDEGFQTTQVLSGSEALRIVREKQFDLILLDLLLPDIDGFAVLGGLRVQPETQLTPIILVSAVNSPADKVRGLQLGADDYITKPFSDVELSARVQAAMRRSEREGGANPSTRLPGNIAIERAISRRIEQHEPFVVCYCDLDNFKAYNDTYGFLKGDAVIQRTAQMLLDAVREYGNPDDFVGHIGGDDFVMISTPERAPLIGAATIERFDAAAPLFYDPDARQRGHISGVDRQGRPAIFPLLSISIVAVSGVHRPFSHPGEVAQRSIEPKKRAKLVLGSTYVVDE